MAEKLKPSHVVVTTAGDDVCVSPVWPGVDRPNVGGVVVQPALAGRLARAMLAGLACTDAVVKTDVNKKTYVSSGSAVLGRTAHADLRRLGF